MGKRRDSRTSIDLINSVYISFQVLSRAFRNRFVELHFDEIPSKELETILHERCAIPLSYCKKMVAVMLDLQVPSCITHPPKAQRVIKHRKSMLTRIGLPATNPMSQKQSVTGVLLIYTFVLL